VANPGEEHIKSLISSTKPPFVASGTTTDPERGVTFRAIYNGRGDWIIERPARSEFLAGGRTVLVEVDDVKVIDIPVVANNDVKGALDGRRIAYLPEALLELIGSTTVAGRSCFEIRAWGLRQGDDRPFDIAVDTDTGAILRMSQNGTSLFEVTEFRIGLPIST
jgi:hypothetical protein